MSKFIVIGCVSDPIRLVKKPLADLIGNSFTCCVFHLQRLAGE